MPSGMQVLALLGNRIVDLETGQSGDPAAVAAAVAAHATLSTAHGSNGAVRGADDLLDLEDYAIEDVIDAFGNTILSFGTSGPTAVNSLTVSNATAGVPTIVLSASGPTANRDISFEVDGTGMVKENGIPLALGNLITAPSTTGVLDAPTKAVIDQIIADLKLCRVYAT